MAGLEKRQGSLTYVNIKEGNLIVKKGETIENYGSVGGVIRKVEFTQETYESQKYEVAKIYIDNVGDLFCLQIPVRTGYFRGFCNSLRSSNNPRGIIKISPSYKKDGATGKITTTCYVTEEGSSKPLKWTYTKANMGNLPQLVKHEIAGKVIWDDTQQLFFWKQWLLSLFEVDSTPAAAPAATTTKEEHHINPDDLQEPLNDLPF